jgi:hypothetical protein
MENSMKMANFPDDAPRGAFAEFWLRYRISRSWSTSCWPSRCPRLTAPEVEECALLVPQEVDRGVSGQRPDQRPTPDQGPWAVGAFPRDARADLRSPGRG